MLSRNDISLSDHYMTYTIYSKISHKTCLSLSLRHTGRTLHMYHAYIGITPACTKKLIFETIKVLILTPLGMLCRKTTLYVILAGQRINLLTSGISLKMVL